MGHHNPWEAASSADRKPNTIGPGMHAQHNKQQQQKSKKCFWTGSHRDDSKATTAKQGTTGKQKVPIRGLEPRYPAWKASMLTTYIMADGILLLKFNLDHYLMATNDKELRSAIDGIRTFMCVTARARAIELTSKIASINFSPHTHPRLHPVSF